MIEKNMYIYDWLNLTKDMNGGKSRETRWYRKYDHNYLRYKSPKNVIYINTTKSWYKLEQSHLNQTCHIF